MSRARWRNTLGYQAWFLFVFAAAATVVGAAESSSKIPVPADDVQMEALARYKQSHGKEHDAARKPEELVALANRLLKLADQSRGEPAGYYVLLRLARDSAARGGDSELSLRAIGKMNEAFRIDQLRAKSEALLLTAQLARSVEQKKALAQCAVPVVYELLDDEECDTAKQLAEAALTAARRTREPELIQKATDCNRRAVHTARAWEQVQDALARLQQKPIDAEANETVGEFYCFLKNEWEKGLPRLVVGNDAKLQSLAQRELQGMASAEAQSQLADAWWDLAQTKSDEAKVAMLSRAGTWYRRARPKIESAELKAKIDKRLAEVATLPSGR